MSKGIKGAIASLALLGLGIFLCASPAAAQLTVAESVASTDDINSPVGAVQAEFDEGGRSITVSWTLSDDDVERQVPTSSDFTTGGTFRNVNDVAGYNIWRCLSNREGGCSGSLAIVGTVNPGVTSLVDASIDVSQGSKVYFYMVSVVDAHGNESTRTESAEVKNMWLLGDFDYNGKVNLLDYSILQANFGQAEPDHPATDMDGNGVVDLEDFFLWADNLGADLYE